MGLSSYQRDVSLDDILGGARWVSIHTGDPGLTGADEVAGGTYARQPAAFAAAAGGNKASNANIDFPGMPAGTFTHVGVWDAAGAGNFRAGGPLTAPQTLPDGATLRLTSGQVIASLG